MAGRWTKRRDTREHHQHCLLDDNSADLHEGHLVEVCSSPSIARIRATDTDTYCVSGDAAIALRRLVGRRIRYRLHGWTIVGFEVSEIGTDVTKA